MKSRFFFNAVLISLAAAFVLPLFSCSDASNDVGAGMVSFYVDKALMQKAVELSNKISKDPVNEPVEEMKRKFRFEVALEGEYSATKTASATCKYELYTGDPTGAEPQEGIRYDFDSFSIDFAGIPVGKTVWAKIRIYEESEQERDEPAERGRRVPTIYGKSNTIQVSSGITPLTVNAYTYQAQVPYKFEFKFDQEVDLSTCDSIAVYAVDPASKFVAKLKNAKSDLDLYEACNDFDEKYREDSYLGEMYLYPDGLNYSEDKKTVTATGDMWIFVSEDDPASRAATALFVLMCQNFSGDAYKTKYYGMASSAVTPMKKQDNIASISAQKFDFIDTSYALYQVGGSEHSHIYDYYLSDSPTSMPSSPAVSAAGTYYDFTSSKPAFCFDAEGNLYAEHREETAAKVKSNNSDFADFGTFTCPYGPGSSPLSMYHITCDMKKNILYGSAVLEGDTCLVPLCSVPDGTGYTVDTQKYYRLNVDGIDIPGASDIRPQTVMAVDNGVGYFIASAGTDVVDDYYLLKATIPTDATSEAVINLPLEFVANLTENINFDTNGNGLINDIICVDGAVYAIYREMKTGWSAMYEDARLGVHSRGALIKCDLTTNQVTTLGWNDKETRNEYYYQTNKLYFAFDNSDAPTQDVYASAAGSSLYLVDGTKYPKDGQTEGELLYKFFPHIKASFNDNSTDSAFACPSRFIAIKPKKLVISDDGIAFYTDASKALSYKNLARVVTIDLVKFAKESVEIKKSPAKFQGVSNYLRMDSNVVNGVTGGELFYDNVYYKDSYGNIGPIGTVTLQEDLYLAIRNGDAD